MSLLDDARKMAQTKGPLEIGGDCWFCEGTDTHGPPWDFKHEDDCPLLSMPKIVAALEAAQHAVDVLHDDERHYEVRTSTHAAVEKIEKALEA